MQTRLTALLGIKYPIIQGGMAWISESRLTSAVSNAGGAGIIACAGRDPEWIRDEIHQTKSLTNKPFGVNVSLLHPKKDEIIEMICREKISFVTLSAGSPVPYIAKLKEAGIIVLAVVPNLKLAQRVEQSGADAVIVEGMESGGHIGALTTMALLTNVIPEVKIPVVAAGGIADGRGIAAALVMGAAGVQLGSLFLLAEECVVHPKFQEMIIKATDTDSVVTGFTRGRGVRALKNSFTDKYLEWERSGVSTEELDRLATGTNRLGAVDGDVENGVVQVGQSLNALKEIRPAREIIKRLAAETRLCLKTAGELAAAFDQEALNENETGC